MKGAIHKYIINLFPYVSRKYRVAVATMLPPADCGVALRLAAVFAIVAALGRAEGGQSNVELACPRGPFYTDSMMYTVTLPGAFSLDGSRNRKLCLDSRSKQECYETLSSSPYWMERSSFVKYHPGWTEAGSTVVSIHEDGKRIGSSECNFDVRKFSDVVHAPKRNKRTFVVDAIMIFDELDMADIRFIELQSTVDLFVVVESKITHSGAAKPLYFKDAMDSGRFSAYHKRIAHIVVEAEDFPQTSHVKDKSTVPHIIEKFQRDQLMRALTKFMDKEDEESVVVIFGDADEIPRASSVKKLRHIALLHHPVALSMQWHHYAFNFISSLPWGALGAFNEGTIAVSLRLLKMYPPSTFRRAMRFGFGQLVWSDMQDAGWHFSRFGGTESVKRKIRASANFRYHDVDETDESSVEAFVQGGVPILNAKAGIDGSSLFAWHPEKAVLHSLPDAVRSNMSAFRHLWTGDSFQSAFYQGSSGDKASEQFRKITAARLKQGVSSNGRAELFARSTGDSNIVCGDCDAFSIKSTSREELARLFLSLCSRLSVQEFVCRSCAEGIETLNPRSDDFYHLLVGYSRTTTLKFNTQWSEHHFPITAFINPEENIQRTVAATGIIKDDAEMFSSTVYSIQRTLDELFLREPSHVVMVAS